MKRWSFWRQAWPAAAGGLLISWNAALVVANEPQDGRTPSADAVARDEFFVQEGDRERGPPPPRREGDRQPEGDRRPEGRPEGRGPEGRGPRFGLPPGGPPRGFEGRESDGIDARLARLERKLDQVLRELNALRGQRPDGPRPGEQRGGPRPPNSDARREGDRPMPRSGGRPEGRRDGDDGDRGSERRDERRDPPPDRDGPRREASKDDDDVTF